MTGTQKETEWQSGPDLRLQASQISLDRPAAEFSPLTAHITYGESRLWSQCFPKAILKNKKNKHNVFIF